MTAQVIGAGQHKLIATYGGDTAHSGGSGLTIVTVTGRSTSTMVSCEQTTLTVGESTLCTATVADTATGQLITATGTVTFSGHRSDNFSPTACTLSNDDGTASCEATYTPTAIGTGQHTITVRYPGDRTHAPSTGQTTITVAATSAPGAHAHIGHS